MYMKQKNLPKPLLDQIRRYLENVLEKKRIIKIDEAEILNIDLPKELKSKIAMFLKSKTLKDIHCLQPFGLEFLSAIVFMFNKRMLLIDETIIYEDETGDELFYIMNGKVGLFHKKSQTFVCNCTKS